MERFIRLRTCGAKCPDCGELLRLEGRQLLRVLLLRNRAVPVEDLPGQGRFVGTAPRTAVGESTVNDDGR